MGKPVRINKFLAQNGFGSRRAVEELVTSGKVSINGSVVKDLATMIDTTKDEVHALGRYVRPEKEFVYIMMNKPPGYLTSTTDPFGRKTVMDLIPDLKLRLFPVGRLDHDSEGLLLLTNDGDFANRIIHPRSKLEKIYKVIINRPLIREELEQLRRGIEIEGKKTKPARVFIRSSESGKCVLRVVLEEGRKRQIRRMIEAIGASVMTLKRQQIGNLKMGKLPVGMWRFLNDNEIRDLRRLTAKREEGKSKHEDRPHRNGEIR